MSQYRGLTIFLGSALAALVGVWQIPGVSSQVCEDWITKTGWRGNPFCGREHQRVSSKEAHVFFEAFYGKASGGDPSEALKMLAGPARENRERFVDAWKGSIYVDVVGTTKELSGFNRFTVRFRDYRWEGVTLKRVRAELRRNGPNKDDIVATQINARRLSPESRHVRHVYLAKRAGTRQAATLNSEPAAFGTEFRRGGHLTAACQVRVADPGEDRGWWTRTKQGWIQNKQLVDGPGKLPGLSRCDPNALRRAAEIRARAEEGAFLRAEN